MGDTVFDMVRWCWHVFVLCNVFGRHQWSVRWASEVRCIWCERKLLV